MEQDNRDPEREWLEACSCAQIREAVGFILGWMLVLAVTSLLGAP